MPKHHFVPQTYLRGFAAEDDPDRVYYYDRRVGDTHKRMIEDVCAQNNLYRLKMDDGDLSDALEESFATVAEPLFTQIVQKLVAHQGLTQPEKSEFAAYISLQLIRTPFSRRVHDSVAEAVYNIETMKQWEKLLDDRVRSEAFARIKQETGRDVSSLTREDIQGLIDGSKFTVKWTMPKENWIKNQMEIMQGIFRSLENMHWRIYYAPRNAVFITSDNPVGILVKKSDGYYVGTGILAPESIRLFPLTSSACLEITDSRPAGFSFEDIDRDRVRQINRVTAMSCDEILIGSVEPLVKWWAKRIRGFYMADAVIEEQINRMHEQEG